MKTTARALLAALGALTACGLPAADVQSWSFETGKGDAFSLEAQDASLLAKAPKGEARKASASFAGFPSSADWELAFVLKEAEGPIEARIVVLGDKGEAAMALGLAPAAFIEEGKDGEAKKVWPPKPVKAAGKTLKLLKLGNVASLALDGEDACFFAMPAGPAKGLKLELASSGKSAATLRLDAFSVKAIAPAAVKHSPLTGKIPKYAFANYIGWFPANYKAPGYMGFHDFPALEQGKPYERQVKLMSDYGWNAVLPDFLFHSPSRVARTCELFEGFGTAIKDLKLDGFKSALFIETLTTDKKSVDAETEETFFSGIKHVLRRREAAGDYLMVEGRPLVFTYASFNLPPARYEKALKDLRADGVDPALVFSFRGLQEAVYGTFDVPKNRPYFDSFEGAFNFSAGSSLEKGAEIVDNIRKAYGSEFPKMIVGAAIAPGYLSTRVENKNFVSPRGTEVLRNWWKTSLASKPDFVHMTTWNDWGEATNFCPSFSVLTSRLEISQRYLCEYFERPLPEGSPEVPEMVLSYRKCVYQGEPLKFETLPLPTLKGPASGRVSIKLFDERGALFDEVKSPAMDMKRMEPWLWRSDKEFGRKTTRLFRVEAALELEGGRVIEYANLPDIAVAYPLSYADQLYYNIPLHKLAGPERGIALLANGSETGAASDGFVAISCAPKGAGMELQTAISKNGHALRLLSPLNARGAEMCHDEREGVIQLRPLAQGEPSAWADWNPSDGAGNDCYSALAQFPDGKWAYSPSVWTEAAFQKDEISAQWVFMPENAKSLDAIQDRSGRGFDLKRQEKDKWDFVKLPGNGRAMRFNGVDDKLDVKPNTALPNGQCSVEATLRFDAVGKEQCVIYQRGAQVSLLIDKDGKAVARRLPEKRVHPEPFVEVRSAKPLAPGKFHQIVASFDSKSLKLSVDGETQGSAPCEGTRSCEVFVIGGPASTSPELSRTIDGMEPDAFFKGEMVRITLFAKALEDAEIKAMFKRASIQPYFK